MVALLKHLKSAKHVNALSAEEDPDTRVVQHQKKNSVEEWLQEHAAGHRMRFAEAVGNRRQRAWNIDCDGCGITLSNVGSMRVLLNHLKSAKHVNAVSADEDHGSRVVQHQKKNTFDEHLGGTLNAAPATSERKRPRS
jgi:hypothetical protein